MYQQTTYFIDNTNIASFLHVETQSQSPVVFLKHVGSRTSINIHPFTISRPWIIVPVFSSLSFQLNTPIFSARKPVSYRRVLRYVRDVPRHVSNRTTFPSRYVHALCTLFPSIFPDFPLLSLSLFLSPTSNLASIVWESHSWLGGRSRMEEDKSNQLLFRGNWLNRRIW